MALPEYFEFQSRTRIIFGNGTLSEVDRAAQELGGRKAFIVTDKIIKGLGLVDKVGQSLKDSSVELAGVLDEVPQDSDIGVVNEGCKMAKDINSDILIAIGGGSVMDTAKGMNILLSEGGDLLEDWQGAYILPRPLKPLIAIPTTAGTGSEVTNAAVIEDRKENVKVTFISPFLCPDVAILDPEVTLSMPPRLTASTGMDALSHAIESIHSTTNEPIADGLAIQAIRMISQDLRKATKNPDDLEARGNMLLASTIAGLAFSNAPVGCVHAMAHACGALCGVPHGIANGLLLPYGMEYNLESCLDRYVLVAEAMGVETRGLSDQDAAKLGVDAIRKLTKDLGLPQRLSEVGVKEENIPGLAEYALGDGPIVTNPRMPENEAEIAEVLKRAL